MQITKCNAIFIVIVEFFFCWGAGVLDLLDLFNSTLLTLFRNSSEGRKDEFDEKLSK